MISRDSLPDGWEWTTIEKKFLFTGKPRELDVSSHATVPFIPMDLIPVHRLYCSDHILKRPDDLTSGVYFESGDLLVSKITPCFENGKQAIVKDIPINFGYATTEVIPIKAIDGVSDVRYLYYYLLEKSVRTDLAARMEGATGRQRLSKSVLESWEIAIPNFTMQKEIANAFESISATIEAKESAVARLKELKASALSCLIFGSLDFSRLARK